ncbi:hypothetical protein Poli38472_013687 [Pythium oligandrum]|uniref:Uncharacterized protein n=1 Tax=Pythium oligandrum TaxID=41045 RepID=A0A8K1CD62_PYTOL|nr:hypothetical protein Poli38472_013687 [Pythium oligandrum]|eukprot:TMW61224.1 hypothetical protein Poli38472_013687 [Pythium oligandrum]
MSVMDDNVVSGNVMRRSLRASNGEEVGSNARLNATGSLGASTKPPGPLSVITPAPLASSSLSTGSSHTSLDLSFEEIGHNGSHVNAPVVAPNLGSITSDDIQKSTSMSSDVVNIGFTLRIPVSTLILASGGIVILLLLLVVAVCLCRINHRYKTLKTPVNNDSIYVLEHNQPPPQTQPSSLSLGLGHLWSGLRWSEPSQTSRDSKVVKIGRVRSEVPSTLISRYKYVLVMTRRRRPSVLALVAFVAAAAMVSVHGEGSQPMDVDVVAKLSLPSLDGSTANEPVDPEPTTAAEPEPTGAPSTTPEPTGAEPTSPEPTGAEPSKPSGGDDANASTAGSDDDVEVPTLEPVSPDSGSGSIAAEVTSPEPSTTPPTPSPTPTPTVTPSSSPSPTPTTAKPTPVPKASASLESMTDPPTTAPGSTASPDIGNGDLQPINGGGSSNTVHSLNSKSGSDSSLTWTISGMLVVGSVVAVVVGALFLARRKRRRLSEKADEDAAAMSRAAASRQHQGSSGGAPHVYAPATHQGSSAASATPYAHALPPRPASPQNAPPPVRESSFNELNDSGISSLMTGNNYDESNRSNSYADYDESNRSNSYGDYHQDSLDSYGSNFSIDINTNEDPYRPNSSLYEDFDDRSSTASSQANI